MSDEAFFWEGVDQGRLLAQQCGDCGALRHPPVPMCPACQSLKWTAQALSGRGKVHAWIVSRHPSRPDHAPRTVVLVDLEEGIRLVSNMEGADHVAIGAPVEVVFREIGGATLPQFRLSAGAGR